jgi:hypothetical protein
MAGPEIDVTMAMRLVWAPAECPASNKSLRGVDDKWIAG